MSEPHASIDSLIAYLDAPASAQSREVGAHLVSCRDCRTQASLLSAVRAQAAGRSELGDLSEAEQLRIAAYVDGESPGAAQETAARLAADKQQLKAALHYACHSAAMRRALASEAETSAPLQASRASTGRWRMVTALLDWRPSVWISAPLGAALTLVVVWMIMPAQQPPSGVIVAAYQDRAVLSFRPDAPVQPGIGFFSAAKQFERPFARMEIALTAQQQLQLRWAPVAGAHSYSLELFIIEQEQRTALGKVSTPSAMAEIAPFNAKPGNRYEWELSGQTNDGYVFSTKGGFVIDVQHD